MESQFAIAEVLPGKLNSLVKNLMKQMRTDDANEAVRRINSGEWFVQSSLFGSFGVWKIIELGTYKFIGDMRQALVSSHCNVTPTADEMMRDGYIQKEETEARLALVSAKDLGFTDGCSYHQFLLTATRSGLLPCRTECGPQLRLQYSRQPKMLHKLGSLCVVVAWGDYNFLIQHASDNTLWLAHDRKSNRDYCRSDELFVLELPQKHR
jgi:hypothetical protein